MTPVRLLKLTSRRTFSFDVLCIESGTSASFEKYEVRRGLHYRVIGVRKNPQPTMVELEGMPNKWWRAERFVRVGMVGMVGSKAGFTP